MMENLFSELGSKDILRYCLFPVLVYMSIFNTLKKFTGYSSLRYSYFNSLYYYLIQFYKSYSTVLFTCTLLWNIIFIIKLLHKYAAHWLFKFICIHFLHYNVFYFILSLPWRWQNALELLLR